MMSGKLSEEEIEEIRAAFLAKVENPMKKPKDFFVKGRLQVSWAAKAVLATGPVARGIDDRLWVWEHGVWVPGDREVHQRIVDILQSRYNPGHQRNIERYMMGMRELPEIRSEPVPGYINLTNGMYDWAGDRLYQFNPDIMSTVQLPVAWDPSASCEQFLGFLGEVIADDAIDFMQEVIGYLCYSGNPMEKAFLLFGEGRNGKGVLMHVIEALLGKENVSHVSLERMTNGHRFATAHLFGKLANIAGELDNTKIKSTADFKSIVGNDKISAEHKGRDAFEFFPFCTNLFSCNEIPPSVDTSTGYMDRWVVIKFPNYFGDNPDTTLKHRLTEPAEIQGVLVWAMHGLRRLMARGGFEYPPSVVSAKEEFEAAVDPVRAFLRECAKRSPADSVPIRDVYPVYLAWASGQKFPLTKVQFNAKVSAMPGVQRVFVHGVEHFKGFALTKGTGDFALTDWF